MGNPRLIWASWPGLLLLLVVPAGVNRPPPPTFIHPVATSVSHLAPVLSEEAAKRPYQIGRASWYGGRFHGRLTANGELFDMFQLTAAHPLLPLGSLVRVTRLRPKRSVIVRINDRGPAHPDSIIDLSYEAARKLDVVERGWALVRLDLVGYAAPRRPDSIAER